MQCAAAEQEVALRAETSARAAAEKHFHSECLKNEALLTELNGERKARLSYQSEAESLRHCVAQLEAKKVEADERNQTMVANHENVRLTYIESAGRHFNGLLTELNGEKQARLSCRSELESLRQRVARLENEKVEAEEKYHGLRKQFDSLLKHHSNSLQDSVMSLRHQNKRIEIALSGSHRLTDPARDTATNNASTTSPKDLDDSDKVPDIQQPSPEVQDQSANDSDTPNTPRPSSSSEPRKAGRKNAAEEDRVPQFIYI